MQLGKNIWYILQKDTPFELFERADPHLVRMTVVDTIAAADDAV